MNWACSGLKLFTQPEVIPFCSPDVHRPGHRAKATGKWLPIYWIHDVGRRLGAPVSYANLA
jgi:hypothetical protein